MGQSSGCAKRPPSKVRRRSAVMLLALGCVTANVAACGKTAPSHPPISVLPAATATGQSWDWTATCTFGPQAPSGCASAGPVIGNAQLVGNEWNLGAGHKSGESVKMALTGSGGLKVNANLSTAPPCTSGTCLTREANTWVRGYPSVLYGLDQCHATTSPLQSTELQLPARVDAIPPDLVGSATYDAQGAQVTYDVAYDLWLSPTATKTPCQKDGTVEVMVWTDYNAKALLPDSLKVGTTTIPYAVDGSFKTGDQAWSVYVNNIYGSGHTVPWGGTVWLVLNAADAKPSGAVSVDLSAALADVGGLLQRNYGWAPFASSYWLDTIAFGMEYGPQDANPYGNGPANFSLNLSKYCLQVGTNAGAATCE